MKHVRVFFMCVFLFFFTGCAWWSGPAEPGTPDALFKQAQEEYQDGDYDDATELFRRLTEEYPLSEYAIAAELGVADSYFSDEDYISAVAQYTDFMEFHPTNENLPYVMFQIGLCHFRQMLGIDRDQTETRMALKSFEKLISRFPSSTFSFPAKQYVKECRERLGEHEFYVGQFYFDIGEYRAAIGRFQIIQEKYARLGMDYKAAYFLDEAKRRLAKEKTE